MENTTTAPFWETKKLEELTLHEWEALCDGCGLCCLHRLQDDEDDEIYLTRVACHRYDIEGRACSDYPNRHEKVEGCMKLTLERVKEFEWLPQTCAYRLRYRGEPLPSWHPLITGNPSSSYPYGMHALDPILESDEIDLEDHVILDELK